MIVEEMVGSRVRHYSNVGMMIRQQPTGVLYEDAVDIVPCPYTYEESDVPIEEEVYVEDKAEAYDILMGVER